MQMFTIDLNSLAVVPVLVGPLQALLAILPALLIAMGGVLVSLFKPKMLWHLLQLLWRQKIAVILVVALLWTLNEVTQQVFNGTAVVSSTDGLEKSDWSMYRGGVSRRGANLQGEDPGHGNIQWSFSDDGIKTFYSSPCIVGNRIYASSARWEFFKKDGAVYSIDAQTGALVWKFNEDGYRATFSSPSVSGKYLVVGEGLHLTKDARIFCIDLEASEQQRQGVKLWDFRTKSHVESSPCIADGKVFCGAGDDGLYCLALDPVDGKAKVLWHKDGNEFPDCESSPVYYQGNVYVGLGLGGQGIVCVDAQTGDLKWRVDTPYPVFGSPSIYDDKLFVGMGHGDFINKAEVVKTLTQEKLKKAGKSNGDIEEAVKDIRPVGEVWCIDLKTAKKKWSYRVGRTVLGSIALADDKLFFGSRDNNLYCLSIEGQLIKKWNAKASITTSPAVGHDLVYTVTAAGRLVGLDKERLKPLWEVNLNSPMSISSPVVGGGHVIVGTNTQGLLCLGKSGLEQSEALWQGDRGAPGSGGAIDGSILPEKGKYAWAYKGDGEQIAQTKATPMYLDGAFYFDSEDDKRHGLVKVKTNEKQSKALTNWFAPSDNPVSLPAAGIGKTVYFVDGKPDDQQRFLRAVSSIDGEERTRYPVGNGSGKFMITDRRLVIHDKQSFVSMFDISNPSQLKLLWELKRDGIQGTPIIKHNMLLLNNVEQTMLELIDADSGITVWKKKVPSPINGDPIFVGNKVWISTIDGVMAFSVLSDDTYIVLRDEIARSPLVQSAERIAYININNELLLVNEDSGIIEKRIIDVRGEHAPLLTEDAVLYLTDGALMRRELNTHQTNLWAKVKEKWPGIPVTSLLMIDSRVYFATKQRGVICMKAK